MICIVINLIHHTDREQLKALRVNLPPGVSQSKQNTVKYLDNRMMEVLIVIICKIQLSQFIQSVHKDRLDL